MHPPASDIDSITHSSQCSLCLCFEPSSDSLIPCKVCKDYFHPHCINRNKMDTSPDICRYCLTLSSCDGKGSLNSQSNLLNLSNFPCNLKRSISPTNTSTSLVPSKKPFIVSCLSSSEEVDTQSLFQNHFLRSNKLPEKNKNLSITIPVNSSLNAKSSQSSLEEDEEGNDLCPICDLECRCTSESLVDSEHTMDAGPNNYQEKSNLVNQGAKDNPFTNQPTNVNEILPLENSPTEKYQDEVEEEEEFLNEIEENAFDDKKSNMYNKPLGLYGGKELYRDSFGSNYGKTYGFTSSALLNYMNHRQNDYMKHPIFPVDTRSKIHKKLIEECNGNKEISKLKFLPGINIPKIASPSVPMLKQRPTSESKFNGELADTIKPTVTTLASRVFVGASLGEEEKLNSIMLRTKPSPPLNTPSVSPHKSPEKVGLSLDDLMDTEQLYSNSPPSNLSSSLIPSTDNDSGEDLKHLTRWDRIPIGAFRRSRRHSQSIPSHLIAKALKSPVSPLEDGSAGSVDDPPLTPAPTIFELQNEFAYPDDPFFRFPATSRLTSDLYPLTSQTTLAHPFTYISSSLHSTDSQPHHQYSSHPQQ